MALGLTHLKFQKKTLITSSLEFGEELKILVYSGRPNEIHIDRSTMMVLMNGLTKFHHDGLLYHIDFDAVYMVMYIPGLMCDAHLQENCFN